MPKILSLISLILILTSPPVEKTVVSMLTFDPTDRKKIETVTE